MSVLVRAKRTLAIAVVGAFVLHSGALADTFTVNSVADAVDDNPGNGVCHAASGKCTLRAAVMETNRIQGDSTIMLPAGTYLFTIDPAGANGDDSGDLDLTTLFKSSSTLTITGDGSASTIVDAAHRDRVLHLHSPRQAVIEGVTLRNGSSDFGGGISSDASFILLDSTLSGNEATQFGGGIYLDSVIGVGIRNTTLSGNHADGNGGGIAVVAGSFNIDDVKLVGNTALGSGGGIYLGGLAFEDFYLYRSTISGNSAAFGGGIRHASDHALNLRESTISGNSAHLGGGGIVNDQTLFMVNCTVAQNGSDQSGGGIYNQGTFWVYNSTIALNRADDSVEQLGGSGGGLFDEGTFNLRNSVVAANTSHGTPEPDDCSGSINTYGWNKFGDFGGCAHTHGGGCGGADEALDSLSELGPLQFNGGPTRTLAVSAASELIDGVQSPCSCQDNLPATINFDQRGGTRSAGARCDIGAFEYAGLPAGLLFADGFESGFLAAWD